MEYQCQSRAHPKINTGEVLFILLGFVKNYGLTENFFTEKHIDKPTRYRDLQITNNSEMELIFYRFSVQPMLKSGKCWR